MGTPRLDFLDKNFIINGAHDFAQRSIGPVNLTTLQSYQSFDRFINYYAGTVTGTPQIQRSTDVPANSFAKYSSQISSRRNASTNDHFRYQIIEDIFARILSNKKISIGFDIKADVATSVQLTLVSYGSPNAGGVGTTFYTSTKEIATGSWQTIKFEDLAMGDLSNGLGVYVVTKAISGTDGAAQSSYLTNLKLNIGTTAHAMSYFGRDRDDELKKCQRYYEKSYGVDVPLGTITLNSATFGRFGTDGNTILTAPFKAIKRVNPVCFAYAPANGAINSVSNISNGANPGAGQPIGGESSLYITFGGGTANGNSGFHWTADSEI